MKSPEDRTIELLGKHIDGVTTPKLRHGYIQLRNDIADAIREAVGAEREACLEIAETYDVADSDFSSQQVLVEIAKQIRARGGK